MSIPIIRLKKIAIEVSNELDWLHSFILKYHSTPKPILTTRADLAISTHHYFRAFALSPDKKSDLLVGISSYEVRTHFLAETQKTIIVPELRYKGWGKAVSQAIEDEVRKAGFTKIRSTIYSDNLAMIRIKLAQGYLIEGFHPNHEAPGISEYSLGKYFPPAEKIE